MDAQEILATVAAMPSEDWMKIQTGIAEMLAARFPGEETSSIREAHSEAEGQSACGDVLPKNGKGRQGNGDKRMGMEAIGTLDVSPIG